MVDIYAGETLNIFELEIRLVLKSEKGEKTVGKMAKRFDSDNKGFLDDSNWILKVKDMSTVLIIRYGIRPSSDNNLLITTCYNNLLLTRYKYKFSYEVHTKK